MNDGYDYRRLIMRETFSTFNLLSLSFLSFSIFPSPAMHPRCFVEDLTLFSRVLIMMVVFFCWKNSVTEVLRVGGGQGGPRYIYSTPAIDEVGI